MIKTEDIALNMMLLLIYVVKYKDLSGSIKKKEIENPF